MTERDETVGLKDASECPPWKASGSATMTNCVLKIDRRQAWSLPPLNS